jgi:Tol biopolymer transport system component
MRPLPALALASLPLLCGACSRDGSIPGDLTGTLVFISDREGRPALYLRRLPDGADFVITAQDEPVDEPALSPSGKHVAFTMGGRVGIVSLDSYDTRFATLGVDWKDAAPTWRPDGKALAVSARPSDGLRTDIHLLTLDPASGLAVREALTETPYLDETSPVFSPDGRYLVFVRSDNLYRLGLKDRRVRRLTGGFRIMRSPRFLPSGRLVCLWTQGKQFGIDLMDVDGENRQTVGTGTAFYRTIAPSPDGRYLAATLSFDENAIRLAQQEEIHLLTLGEGGQARGTLARSWRRACHSPDWGR